MLTLGIRPGEYIVIGDNIVVKAVQLENQIQLGIEAPKDEQDTKPAQPKRPAKKAQYTILADS